MKPSIDTPESPARCQQPIVRLRIVDDDYVIKLRTPCPYCGGKLTAQAEGWEECGGGIAVATDLVVSCETEPDISRDRAWNDWWATHGEQDFGDVWCSLKERIAKRLAAEGLRYRMAADSSSQTNVPALSQTGRQETSTKETTTE